MKTMVPLSLSVIEALVTSTCLYLRVKDPKGEGSLVITIDNLPNTAYGEALAKDLGLESILRLRAAKRRPAITFTTRRTKKLAELTAADIPRGLQPEDVALDYDSEPHITNEED